AADPEGLLHAAELYDRTAVVVDDVRIRASSAVAMVTSASAGSGIRAFERFWNRYDANGVGWLTDTAHACRQLARGLRDFADVVRQARHRIEEQVAVDGAVVLGGIALSWCTFGLSDLAAGAATAALVSVAEAAGATV